MINNIFKFFFQFLSLVIVVFLSKVNFAQSNFIHQKYIKNKNISPNQDTFNQCSPDSSTCLNEDTWRLPCLNRDEGDHCSPPTFYVDRLVDMFHREDSQDRCHTKNEMVEEVGKSWERPDLTCVDDCWSLNQDDYSFVQNQLKRIIIPEVNFSNMPLSQLVPLLSNLSVEFDKDSTCFSQKGINIVLIDPQKKDPLVTLMLRNCSLDKILKCITQSINYQYDIEDNYITLRPSYGNGNTYLKTEFFYLSRATVIQFSNFKNNSHSRHHPSTLDVNEMSTDNSSDDFSNTESNIQSFLQRAGVDFNKIEGASIAFDGSQLIVTQTPSNIERVRNILKRYSQIKQVEIEAKFMEVQQGILEELGFQWNLKYGNTEIKTSSPSNNQMAVRSLSNAFTPKGLTFGDGFVRSVNPLTGAIASEQLIPSTPPVQPNAINIGVSANDIANIIGIGNKFKIEAIIRALEQHTGTDLMSAPKVTVLSGKTAEIVVAQELRYPNSYGDIDSAVGSASLGTSSAGVTITAGTPHDFKVQRVGVQMKVTPIVEENNRTISLKLEPKVTEFEGFVEYGGMSVAISGNTTVNVPSGFFQPVFSVRQIQTEVSIYDGATVVMGGLTREEVREVKDKVPFLGDLPVLGRFFRSKGETSQKRNLLIFVTANLVTPGGITIAQQACATSDSIQKFQNKTKVTPSGLASTKITSN